MKSKNKLRFSKPLLVALFAAIMTAGSVLTHAQVIPGPDFRQKIVRKPFKVEDEARLKKAFSIDKKKSEYTKEDWQALIDARWGEGESTQVKLEIFDAFWARIDEKSAIFPNLGVDWDSLYSHYRPEIEAGVSRGRLFAIMSQLCLGTQDAHVQLWDTAVYIDVLEPGVPLMSYYPYSESNHFGASLTPLPDSSLLVYQVAPVHPLGLERGDRVLGYEGVPWKSLYKKLLSYELPVTCLINGSHGESITHYWLAAAGENWHLFDTIDIIKYGSADTLHLPTSPLANQEPLMTVTEQLPVPGVAFPDFENHYGTSWGVVEGTNIGYIYTAEWMNEVFQGVTYHCVFEEAVVDLMYNRQVDGLIIDTRYDWGGHPSLAMDGMKYLFNRDIDKIGFVVRNDPENRLGFEVYPPFSSEPNAGLKADPGEIFDRPIAVLTGPGSLSNGDLFPLMMSYHPYVRRFGKPTCGAYSGYYNISAWADSLLPSDYTMYYPDAGMFLINEPVRYLDHQISDVDEEIWLEPDAVARGEDNVVTRAMEWIRNKVYPFSAVEQEKFYWGRNHTAPVGVHLQNPNNHDVEVWAYLLNEADSLMADSVMLTNVDSNLYTGDVLVPDLEDYFAVSYKSYDKEDGDRQELPSVNFFTSAGPVQLEHFEVRGSDTIPNPGDIVQIRFYFENNSQQYYFTDAFMNLEPIDSCLSFSDQMIQINALGPGKVAFAKALSSLEIDSSCVAPSEIPLKVNIYLDEKLYRSDTAFLLVEAPASGVAVPDKDDMGLRIYPNPASTIITLETGISDHYSVEIVSVNGQMVLSREMEGTTHQIDLSSFQSGVYFITIRSADFVTTRKMIKL